MIKVTLDEDEVLSLDMAAEVLSERYDWKDYEVDAKEGQITFFDKEGAKYHLDLGGFAYMDCDKDGNECNASESVEKFNVDFCEDLNCNNIIFGKNDDGETVIIHD